MKQWQDLEDENWDPAKRVGDNDREEPFGDGHLVLDVVAVFSCLRSRSLDIIKHTCVGEDNDEKCHHVQTCRETEGYGFWSNWQVQISSKL